VMRKKNDLDISSTPISSDWLWVNILILCPSFLLLQKHVHDTEISLTEDLRCSTLKIFIG